MELINQAISSGTSSKTFAGGLVVKNSPANAGDEGLILGSGRSPWRREWQLLRYSCLESPMDRGAWRATALRVTKSQTRLWTKQQSQGPVEGAVTMDLQTPERMRLLLSVRLFRHTVPLRARFLLHVYFIDPGAPG